jgi:hypothetical protein
MTRRCAGRPVLRVWLALPGNGDDDGGCVAWVRELKGGVVTLYLDLRAWYVVFITGGAACATLQVSSVLGRIEWGCVSALSPDFLASCSCMCCYTC